MLHMSSALYRLALWAAGPTHHPVAGAHRVKMSNLRELIIGDVNCAFSINMLEHIHAPRLVALTIVHVGGPDCSQLLSTITGMFPELQLLSLSRLKIPTSDETTRAVVLWLESMPRIKMLKVVDVKRTILDVFCQDPTQYWTQSQTDAYLRSWREKNGGRELVRPVLLPNLEYLHFNEQAAGDEISVLTTARQAIGRPFKTAYTPDFHLKTIPADELEKIRDSVGALEIIDGLKPTPVEWKWPARLTRAFRSRPRSRFPRRLPPTSYTEVSVCSRLVYYLPFTCSVNACT